MYESISSGFTTMARPQLTEPSRDDSHSGDQNNMT